MFLSYIAGWRCGRVSDKWGGGSLLRKGMLMMLSRSDGLRGASVRDVKLANGNTLASYCAYEL